MTRSYEGLEAGTITINDGVARLTSSDDGINVAGGADSSGGQWPGGPGGGGAVGDYHLYINGGLIVMDASGDGLDSNGYIEFNGGTALVNGPTQTMNGALDCNGDFSMNGGFLVAAGSADMPEVPDNTSDQPSTLVVLECSQSAGTLFHVRTTGGEEILTFAPSKSYQSVAFSTAQMSVGEDYEVYVGGSSTGVESDGLYAGGVYTPGTLMTTFSQSSVSVTVGRGGGPPRP